MRRDNPWRYWAEVIFAIALVATAVSVVAAKFGVNIELPKFK